MDGDRIRLVVFDRDGTLLRRDTVCEAIARRIGKLDRMRELEAYPWSRVVEARDEMAAWYRQHSLQGLLEGVNQVCFAPGAAEGVDMLRHHGIEVAIASASWDFGVKWVAERLGVRHWLGTGLSPAGLIAHVMPAELLQAARRAYCVGEHVPDPLRTRVVHRPSADIAALARELVDD